MLKSQFFYVLGLSPEPGSTATDVTENEDKKIEWIARQGEKEDKWHWAKRANSYKKNPYLQWSDAEKPHFFFKDFQIPDPVPILSLGRDTGKKKKTNTDWVWKRRGLRITNPRISYLAHDSSQNPTKSHFANFLVVFGSWCSRRHFQVSAWATVVVERSTWAKTWTQWTGTRTRKQGTKPVLARTQQKQMNSSMRGDFGRYPIPLVYRPWNTRMPYEEAKQDEQRVKAGKCKQILLDSSLLRGGSWSLKNCSITRPSR